MFGSKNNRQVDEELFVVYDSKIKKYVNRIFAPNSEDLIRQTINMFRDPSQAQNQLLLNAEDYSVFRVAQYEKTTGVITPINHEHVVNLHDLRAAALERT